MKQASMKRWLTAVVTAAWLTAGCGGGDDSNDPQLPPPEPTGRVSIVSGNAREVAAEGASATLQGMDSGADLLLAAQVETLPLAAPEAGALARKGLQRVMKTPSAQALAGIEASQDFACESGTLTVAVDTASGTLQPGDSFSLTFKSCVEEGVSLNGSMHYALTAVTGDILGGGAFSLTAGVTFGNLVALKDGEGARIHGSATAVINKTDDDHYSVALSGSGLSTDRYEANAAVATRTLSNFNSTQAVFAGTRSHSLNATLTGNFPRLGTGAVFDVQTLAPLATDLGAQYPKSGKLKIVGRANSSVTLTVRSSSSVLLEIDADGDGTAEGSTVLTWTELLAFLS